MGKMYSKIAVEYAGVWRRIKRSCEREDKCKQTDWISGCILPTFHIICTIIRSEFRLFIPPSNCEIDHLCRHIPCRITGENFRSTSQTRKTRTPHCARHEHSWIFCTIRIGARRRLHTEVCQGVGNRPRIGSGIGN